MESEEASDDEESKGKSKDRSNEAIRGAPAADQLIDKLKALISSNVINNISSDAHFDVVLCDMSQELSRRWDLSKLNNLMRFVDDEKEGSC